MYVIIFFGQQRYLHLQIFMELKLYQSVILAFSLCIFTLMYICSSLFFVYMLWSNYWYTHKQLNMLSQTFFALSYTKYAKHIVNTCSVIFNSKYKKVYRNINCYKCLLHIAHLKNDYFPPKRLLPHISYKLFLCGWPLYIFYCWIMLGTK